MEKKQVLPEFSSSRFEDLEEFLNEEPVYKDGE